MCFLGRAITALVVGTGLYWFSESPANAFWLSIPGVSVELQRGRGSVSFPYAAVCWDPHGGVVAFPGGKVRWGHYNPYVAPPGWHHWEPYRR